MTLFSEVSTATSLVSAGVAAVLAKTQPIFKLAKLFNNCKLRSKVKSSLIAALQHRIVATKTFFLFFFTLLSNSLSSVKFLSFCDLSCLSVQFRNSV
jgi:hypothetical protein